MHIVNKNYTALFDYGIKMLVTYQLYILDPRFVPRLLEGSSTVLIYKDAINCNQSTEHAQIVDLLNAQME